MRFPKYQEKIPSIAAILVLLTHSTLRHMFTAQNNLLSLL